MMRQCVASSHTLSGYLQAFDHSPRKPMDASGNRKIAGYNNVTAHRLVGLVATHYGVIGWEDATGQEILKKCIGCIPIDANLGDDSEIFFKDVFGLKPQNEEERMKWEHEHKHRPTTCDADHLFGRVHLWMNGLFFIAVTGHRENTHRSLVRMNAGLWLFLWSSKAYTNGNV